MKRLTVTPEIQTRLDAAAKGPVDPAEVAVFEAIAMTSAPFDKPGSVYDKATFDPTIWAEMSTFLNDGASVPVHTMHDSQTLNVGRCVYAGVRDGSLHVQFYLMKDNPLVPEIENGIVNQVSVSVMAKQLICSASGYDFKAHGEEGLQQLFWSRKDPDGNEIGQGNVHLHLKGLEDWKELSLVNTGGSPGAYIISPEAASLSKKNLDRLSFNQLAHEQLITSVSGPVDLSGGTQLEADTMEIESLVLSLTKANETAAKNGADLAVALAELGRLKTELAQRDATVADLQKENNRLTALVPKAAENETQLAKVMAYVKGMAQKALTATKNDAAPAEDFDGMVRQIDAAGVNLANLAAADHAQTSKPSADNSSQFASKNAAQMAELFSSYRGA